MRDKIGATRSEIFDQVPFQESRQLGIAEHTENSGLGCAQSPCPRSRDELRQKEAHMVSYAGFRIVRPVKSWRRDRAGQS